jgi:hypothetical protein
MHRPERERLVEISLFAVLFLVFFQLLTTFIEKTYVFGLLQTDIPAEIAFVLFLLLPVILLFVRKSALGTLLVYLGLIMLVLRGSKCFTRYTLADAAVWPRVQGCFWSFWPLYSTAWAEKSITGRLAL